MQMQDSSEIRRKRPTKTLKTPRYQKKWLTKDNQRSLYSLRSLRAEREDTTTGPFRPRMRSCLRSSIHLPRPILSRQFHSSINHQTQNFTDDPSNTLDEGYDPFTKVAPFIKYGRDETAYAHKVNDENLKRWQESQEPKGKIQFMSLGQEFTAPFNLSSLAQQDLNHMRELRAYYRKIMYEMPQFKSN